MSTLNIQPPSNLLLFTELGRGIFNLGTYFATLPLLNFMPCGDGHPVLVLPGFLTTDNTTLPMRYFLELRNYKAKPWELGRNMINYEELEKQLIDTVKRLADEHGQKVSIVGWSAGGIFARAIAHSLPEHVRQVITLGSPFRGIEGKSNLEFMMQWVTGKDISELDRVVLERAAAPPPVPSTAIYTRLDGIVHWQTCVDVEEDNQTENIEVFASHVGLGFDPMALLCVADRLGQPENNWKRFKDTTVGRIFYTYPWHTK